MLLGFEIGQRWSEAVMHSCGSYFVPVPNNMPKDLTILGRNPHPEYYYEHKY
jgi:hypothetical protein